MKRIGLIGGLSWQSTVDYYRIINEESAKRLGGLNNVESIVYSVNLNEMLEHMGKGEVEILGGKFAAVGKKLEEAGADLIVLCTNTMHAACAQLEESIHVPFIHIADATADEIKRLGLHKVGDGHTVHHGSGLLQGPACGISTALRSSFPRRASGTRSTG